ncbi:hypothetical protein [Bacillus sp. FJAT-44742]
MRTLICRSVSTPEGIMEANVPARINAADRTVPLTHTYRMSKKDY